MKLDIDKFSLEYCDGFCAGWNLARCGEPASYIKHIQEANAKNSNTKEINTGMADGWIARNTKGVKP